VAVKIHFRYTSFAIGTDSRSRVWRIHSRHACIWTNSQM